MPTISTRRTVVALVVTGLGALAAILVLWLLLGAACTPTDDGRPLPAACAGMPAAERAATEDGSGGSLVVVSEVTPVGTPPSG